jgi:predicted nuclease of predicted toxin-antitoxin system
MNLLLDECVPKGLKRHFAEGHTCSTVSEAGFAGKTNGELLRLSRRKFQVLITLDKGMPFQQNLSGINIAIPVDSCKLKPRS